MHRHSRIAAFIFFFFFLVLILISSVVDFVVAEPLLTPTPYFLEFSYLPIAANVISSATVVTPITPVPTHTPTIMPTHTQTAVPTPLPTATPSPPQGCNTCASNEYNCPYFDDWASAQACYEYCLYLVGEDIHRLNNDPAIDNCACDCNAGAPPSCGCTQKASKQLTPAQRLQTPSTEICYP